MSIHFNISPIKALDFIFDDAAYIICSMEDSNISGPNVLAVNCMDVDISHPYAFKIEDANAIIDFVSDAMKRGVNQFWVCCDAGESRSPAIVAALLEAYNQDSDHVWNDNAYHPNMHVYEVMTGALKCKGILK